MNNDINEQIDNIENDIYDACGEYADTDFVMSLLDKYKALIRNATLDELEWVGKAIDNLRGAE